MKNTKAQSAMEYLMTYGWAILIIVVVLAVLFSLGLFNGSKIVGTTCRTSSEYICQGVSYSGGTLSLTIGPSSGIDWQSYMISYVPSSFTSTASSELPDLRMRHQCLIRSYLNWLLLWMLCCSRPTVCPRLSVLLPVMELPGLYLKALLTRSMPQ